MTEPEGQTVARGGRLGGPAAAAAVLALVAGLAFGVTDEVIERRRDGFCRPDHGIAGAVASETRTWWPLGERCRLRLADGTRLVREPGWALTGLVATWLAVVAVGGLAPPGSVRRRLGWTLVVPVVPLAVLIQAVTQPRSFARLVSLTSISLGFGSVMAAFSAVAVWYVMRGRILPTVLGCWLAWGSIVFIQGKDAVGL
ncbi:MAG: hypothetical protein ACRD0S_02955 [Acidimicrobiales bacterium]